MQNMPNYPLLNLLFRKPKNRFSGSQKTATKNAKKVKNIPVIMAIIPPPSPGPKYKSISYNFLINNTAPKKTGNMVLIESFYIFYFFGCRIPNNYPSMIGIFYKNISIR